MNFPAPGIFSGEVAHRRVAPVRHMLRYRVFSVLVDLEDIDGFARRSRFFSHNRWNLLSLYDRDHGDGETGDLAGFIRRIVAAEVGPAAIASIYMHAYPRVLGYVFNPLTVYFCLDEGRRPVAVVYEVNNTFGGRTHYVSRAGGRDRAVTIGGAEKRMAVSPFNGEHGRYGFRLGFDAGRLAIGVTLAEGGRAVMNAWYAARRHELSDWRVLFLAASIPLMTLKVIGAIHLEAGRLWLKGLRPKSRPALARAVSGPAAANRPAAVKRHA
jgi:DUF1365 family protein